MAAKFPSPLLSAFSGFAQGFAQQYTQGLSEQEKEKAKQKDEERQAFLKAYYSDPTAFNSPAGEKYFRDLFPDKEHGEMLSGFRSLLHNIGMGGGADATAGGAATSGAASSGGTPAPTAASPSGGIAADRTAAMGEFAKHRSEARQRFLTEPVPTGTSRSMKMGGETVTRRGPGQTKETGIGALIDQMRAADASGDTQKRDALMQDLNNKLTTPEQKEAIFVDKLKAVLPIQHQEKVDAALDKPLGAAEIGKWDVPKGFVAKPGTSARELRDAGATPKVGWGEWAMEQFFPSAGTAAPTSTSAGSSSKKPSAAAPNDQLIDDIFNTHAPK